MARVFVSVSRGLASAELHIHDWRACARILASGDVGFAEALRERWVDCHDLTSLLRLATVNRAARIRPSSAAGWRDCGCACVTCCDATARPAAGAISRPTTISATLLPALAGRGDDLFQRAVRR